MSIRGENEGISGKDRKANYHIRRAIEGVLRKAHCARRETIVLTGLTGPALENSVRNCNSLVSNEIGELD